jgi:hypothetical protein
VIVGFLGYRSDIRGLRVSFHVLSLFTCSSGTDLQVYTCWTLYIIVCNLGTSAFRFRRRGQERRRLWFSRFNI